MQLCDTQLGGWGFCRRNGIGYRTRKLLLLYTFKLLYGRHLSRSILEVVVTPLELDLLLYIKFNIKLGTHSQNLQIGRKELICLVPFIGSSIDETTTVSS